jgi:excisionase family DNA binding protein
MAESQFITISQAAELLGNTVQHVRLLARNGHLKANKVGRDWLMDRDAVLDLREKRITSPLIKLDRRGRPSNVFVSESKGKYHLNNNKRPLKDNPVAAGGAVFKIATTEPLVVKRAVDPRNQLNELTATEWLPETVSVWVQKGLGASHADAQIERQHPAPFSFTDVARLIRFFTKRGAVVLDPFVGVGSTLKACALDRRLGIGIELNPLYVQLTQARLSRELPKNILTDHGQRVILGDVRDVLPQLSDDSVDFIVTSPPYGNILHKEDHKARQERISNGLATRYSNDSRDLGNIHEYENFLSQLSGILGACGRVLKSRKYMAVIVSDYRSGSKYVTFHTDLAHSLEAYNIQLRGITILYQRHKRVFPYGYPYAFVPNIHHQFILIMQNEKPK